ERAGGVDHSNKLSHALWFGIAGALGGGLVGAFALLAIPVAARRIRSGRELVFATRLPLLATLDDVNAMTEEQRRQWALRTFALVRSKLARSDDESLICGFTSAERAEGRSTLIRLLAEAAAELSYEVVLIHGACRSPTRMLDLKAVTSRTEPGA